MSGRVITLTGPSGSGKTEITKAFYSGACPEFIPVVIKKFTTRKPRDEETESGNSDLSEKIFVSKLPPECDIVYESYGIRYGLNSREIWNAVRAKNSAIIVVNDVRAVEQLREMFGRLVCSVFLFRQQPMYEQQRALAEKRGNVSLDEAWDRFSKAHSILRIYIENIHLFDRVILNVSDFDVLSAQATHVIREDAWRTKLLSGPDLGS